MEARGAVTPGLFEEFGTSSRAVGRLSFFGRLHLAKGGPRAQWEDVLFAMLPEPAPVIDRPALVHALPDGEYWTRYGQLCGRLSATLTPEEQAELAALQADFRRRHGRAR